MYDLNEVKGMVVYMKKNKLSEKQQMKLILVIIFLMIFVLNLLTPIIADDYSYSLALDDTKIDSLMDIINYQVWHYFNWGGRTIAHTVAQIFLPFPKIIFSFINSLVYVLLIFLMYLHIKGKNKDKPLYLLIIHLSLWFLLPVFGQTCLWLVGSCNYLWTTTLILLFLRIYKKNDKSSSVLKLVAIFFLGILAGWTNENTSAGLIAILLGNLIIDRITKKRKKISKMQLSGLIGVLIGFLIMILAPGNFVRTAEFKDDTFILLKIIKRAIDITITAGSYLLPIIIFLVIALSIKIYNKKKIEEEAYVFIAGSLVAIYSMVLSPTFPTRSWTGVIVYQLIACLILFYNMDKIHKIYKYIIVDCCIIFSTIYITQYMDLGKDINNLRSTWKDRISEIEKLDNNDKITFDKYIPYNSKNPAWELSDLSVDDTQWPNTAIAKYYKIKSISAKE